MRKLWALLLVCLGAGSIVAIRAFSDRRIESASAGPELENLNVILVTIDTLRADFVGSDRADTPHLDKLAEEGVFFDKCLAQTPLTLPSHTTILSGTYPLHHRVIDNGGFRVPAELKLVSETLQDKGFKTSAFISAFVLHSKWGLNQGFDTYSDDFDRTAYDAMLLQNDRSAEEVLHEAEAWLKANESSRFFTWIHLFGPHSPYTPPPAFDKYPNDPYRGEVEYVDDALGGFFRFLREAGLYDESLIIVTGDHGEALGQHREQEHGYFVYDPTVRVPLIVRAPSEFPVSRVATLVEHVDLAPTILDALGIPVPDSYQGESLLSLMMGEEPTERVAYTETFYPRLNYGWSELRAIYRGKWKYIWAPDEELYNLDADPGERENLAGSRLTERNELRSELRKFVEREAGSALSQVPNALDREDRQRLEALGYLSGGTADAASGELPDPKNEIAVFNDLETAGQLIDEGRHDEALQLLTTVTAREPNNARAHALMGDAYQEKRMYVEALRSHRELLRLKPDDNFARFDVVAGLVNLGRFDAAIEEAERSLELYPADPVLVEMLGLAYFYKNDLERAVEFLEKSVHIEESSSALSKLGEIHASRGDFEKAVPLIRRALDINPRSPGAHYTMALIEEANGDLPSALDSYEKELSSHPADFRASFNAGNILQKLGKNEEAIAYYERTIGANPSFNVPYFLVARYLVEQGRDVDEAIALSKKGIAIEPADQYTLLGYQILVDIYVRRSDEANYGRYIEKGEELYESLKAEGRVPLP